MARRIVVGCSGASGMPIALEVLRCLRKAGEESADEREQIEIHLIYTQSARMTLLEETAITEQEFRALADAVYENENIGAATASGSFQTEGMIIVPCSMKTAAGICCGYSENLLLRTADVMLKERRKLVLVTRECPFSTIHLRNLYELSQMGAVILPPMLTYYNHPHSVEDCTKHITGKILDQFGIICDGYQRWNGMEREKIKEG
ncbi:MAG: UbiX family flavin prenyltransferase [Fusicatenibacter sp.]